jgi:transposase-like protein
MKTLNLAVARVLKRLHYPLDVILMCVRWDVAYPLSLRHLEEMMAERGVSVDHSVVVQIAQASAKPCGCSSSQRAERTAVQTEGTAVSLRGSFIRLNWPLRMRCISSMPEMVVAAVLKRLKPSITFTRALRLR